MNHKKQVINLLSEYQKVFAENVIGDYATQIEMGEAEVAHLTGINWGFRIMKQVIEGNVSTQAIQNEISKMKTKVYQAEQRLEDGKPNHEMPSEALAN